MTGGKSKEDLLLGIMGMKHEDIDAAWSKLPSGIQSKIVNNTGLSPVEKAEETEILKTKTNIPMHRISGLSDLNEIFRQTNGL